MIPSFRLASTSTGPYVLFILFLKLVLNIVQTCSGGENKYCLLRSRSCGPLETPIVDTSYCEICICGKITLWDIFIDSLASIYFLVSWIFPSIPSRWARDLLVLLLQRRNEVKIVFWSTFLLFSLKNANPQGNGKNLGHGQYILVRA